MDGILDGPVALFGADADQESESFSAAGLMFTLLGVTDLLLSLIRP